MATRASTVQRFALTPTIPGYLSYANRSTRKVVCTTYICHPTPPSRSSSCSLFLRCRGLSVGSLACCRYPRCSIRWTYHSIPRLYDHSANPSVFPSFPSPAALRQPHTSSLSLQITPIISIPKIGYFFTTTLQYRPRIGDYRPLLLYSPAACVHHPNPEQQAI